MAEEESSTTSTEDTPDRVEPRFDEDSADDNDDNFPLPPLEPLPLVCQETNGLGCGAAFSSQAILDDKGKDVNTLNEIEKHRNFFYSEFGPVFEQLKASGHQLLRSEEYNEIASYLMAYKKGEGSLSMNHRRWQKRYTVSTKEKEKDPVNLNDYSNNILLRNDRRVVMYDKVYDVIQYIHEQLGHPRDSRKHKTTIDNFYYGVSEKLIKLFVNSCPLCQEMRGTGKRLQLRKSGLLFPIANNEHDPSSGNRNKKRHCTSVSQSGSTHPSRTVLVSSSCSSRSKTTRQEDRVVEELLGRLTAEDPLLRLDGGASCINLNDDTATMPIMTLERAMLPLSVDNFRRYCFRQKAVHVKKANNNNMMGDLISAMHNLNVLSILKHTSSSNIFVWIVQKQERRGENSAIQSLDVENPDHAYALYKHGGHALYCRAPPDVEQPLVASFLADTGLGCGQYDPSGRSTTCLGRGEVETFISPKNHVTEFHTDFQENFTFQLSGVKKWRLRQGSVKHPIRGCTPHYAETSESIETQLKTARLSNPNFAFDKPNPNNSFGREEEVIMTAGDVLYFPAGMWHSVETLEEGISINISLMGMNYANLVTNALQHFLLSSGEDQWKETIAATNAKHDCDTLQNLHNLLTSSLPSVIRDFIHHVGAESILPPVVRYPPSFTPGNNNNDSDDASSCTSSTGNDSSDDVIVNVEHFIGPEGWNYEKPILDDDDCDGTRIVLTKNPLASLISQEVDLLMFCNSNSSSSRSPEMNKSKKRRYENAANYILNVNFAGNDLLESSVRVIFACHQKEHTDLFQNYVAMEKEGKDPASIHNKDNAPKPPSCLFFYGYFVWVKERSYKVDI